MSAAAKGGSLRARAAVGGALTLALLSGCSSAGTAATSSGSAVLGAVAAPTSTISYCHDPVVTVHPTAATRTLERAATVVDSLAAHAWNANAPARRGGSSGGVYINWRPMWDGAIPTATLTNVGTDGRSDSQAGHAERHDPLADLLTLRGILGYFAAGGHNARAHQLACRLRPVVAQEFAAYGVDRAWVYGVLVDLSGLDSQGPWLQDAHGYAQLLARIYVDPASGVQHQPTSGVYRSDYAAETAAALADAGARFLRPDWTELGRRAAIALVQRAADPTTGLLPGTMTVAPGPRDTVSDPFVKIGAQAQALNALLTVYDLTHEASLLAAVTKAATTLDNPAVGVHDTAHGGWFFGLDASGTGVNTTYKETRQAWMLQLAKHLQSTTGRDILGVTGLETLVGDQLIRTNGAGYAYRVAPDFSPYMHVVNGSPLVEDWISTEGTGIALTVLLPLGGTPPELITARTTNGNSTATTACSYEQTFGGVDVTAPLLPAAVGGAVAGDLADADIALDGLGDTTGDPPGSGALGTRAWC